MAGEVQGLSSLGEEHWLLFLDRIVVQNRFLSLSQFLPRFRDLFHCQYRNQHPSQSLFRPQLLLHFRYLGPDQNPILNLFPIPKHSHFM